MSVPCPESQEPQIAKIRPTFDKGAMRCLTQASPWSSLLFACCSALGLLLPLAGFASGNVHTTWLWHLHQPIYWPDRRNWGGDHYEAAWDTMQQQNAGRLHPSPEVVSSIFD